MGPVHGEAIQFRIEQYLLVQPPLFQPYFGGPFFVGGNVDDVPGKMASSTVHCCRAVGVNRIFLSASSGEQITMRNVGKLGAAVSLSAVLLGGCNGAASIDTTAAEETTSASLNQTIDGKGIQLVMLKLPGMT